MLFTSIVICFVLSCLKSSVEAAECGDLQWECSTGTDCIDSEFLCDGEPQCPDGSDETFHFCSNLTCPGYAFRCAYGGCVDKDAACNGKVDCADKSDEILPSCPGVVSVPEVHDCSDLEFACLNEEKCIDGTLKCDGVADCKLGSDETLTQCHNFPCPEYAFRCAYGGCVDSDAPCNGVMDCADGSDEFAPQCNTTGPPPTSSPPLPPDVPIAGSGNETNVPRVGSCRLPPPPEHGTYSSYTCEPGSQLPECRAIAGTPVRLGFDLHFECYNGFSIRGNTEQYCRNGGWYPPKVPICSDECEPLLSSRLDLHCFNDRFKPVPCNRKMPSNSFARFQCRPAIYMKVKEPGYNRLVCQNGEWDRPLTDDFCQPACGRAVLNFAQPVISYGEVAGFGNFPWHAGIYEFDENKDDWRLNCGASLVSHNLLISAAHCFKKEVDRELVTTEISQMRIALGKRYATYGSPLDRFTQTYEIKQVISNPDYTGSLDNYGNDIALIILKESVKYTPAVLPVCLDLGQDNTEEEQLVPGAIGMVAGWGATERKDMNEELLVAKMPYVSREVCRKSTSLWSYVTKDKLCAGDPINSKTSVCKGDSGGGFVLEDKKTRTFYLRGIVSLGPVGCKGQDYALFTRLSKHSDFIDRYL